MNPLDDAYRLFSKGAFAEAVNRIEILEGATGRSTDSALLMGVCLARLKQIREAIAVLEEVLREDPDCYDALTWMAALKKNRETIDEATRCAERAIKIRPDLAAGHGALGGCLLYMRKPHEAIESFKRAASLSPGGAETQHNLAIAYQMLHDHRAAVSHFAAAVSLAPRAAQSYVTLANEYATYGSLWEAVDCLKRGIQQNPSSHLLHSSLAMAYSKVRKDDLAETHFQVALELSMAAREPFALWLLNQGRFSEAESVYTEMLSDESTRCLAFYGILQCRKAGSGDGAFIHDMEAELAKPGIGAVSEAYVRFALAKGYEQLGEYERAMEQYDAANALAYSIHNAGDPFDLTALKRSHSDVKRLFEQTLTDSQITVQEPAPIFIVGMIRSGTTLLEQIVSSHPSVLPAGEIRFWIEKTAYLLSIGDAASSIAINDVAGEYREYVGRVTGQSGRFTDKMPLNFSCLGIILRAIPNAKFVHIRRNPVDTCFSIYTTYFGKGPEFAYDRANIAGYFQAYADLMAYWHAVVPTESLLEVNYEDLVSDSRSVIARVLEFCGLPWDDACLQPERNEGSINTPSRWQARQPIYRSSVARWENFKPWLSEFSALSPESVG